MKAPKNISKKVSSKGKRLKWESLKDVKPVHLTPELTVGNLVLLNNNSNKNNHLVS